MIDIDDFQKVNDTRGHQQGDEVLRKIGATINRSVRKMDLAARYGGEELAVIMPNTDIDYAREAIYRGLTEIRQFYTALLEGLPDGFWNSYKLNRQAVVGEVGYILWEAKPWFAMATDTFVVREGKIRYQTFAVTTSYA